LFGIIKILIEAINLYGNNNDRKIIKKIKENNVYRIEIMN